MKGFEIICTIPFKTMDYLREIVLIIHWMNDPMKMIGENDKG